MTTTKPITIALAYFLVFHFAPCLGISQETNENTTKLPDNQLANELKYVPDNAFAISVLHSADLLDLAGEKFIPGANALPLPFKHSDVDSLTAFAMPGMDRNQRFNIGLVLQFNKDVSASALARALIPDSVRQESPEFKFFAPKSFSRRAGSPPIFFILSPDPRTAILATEPNFLFQLFANAKRREESATTVEKPWEPLRTQMLERKLTGQLVGAVDYARLSHYLLSHNIDYLTEPGRESEIEFPVDSYQFDAAFASFDFNRTNTLEVFLLNARDETRELAIVPSKVPAAKIRGFFDVLVKQSPKSAAKNVEALYERFSNLFQSVEATETSSEIRWASSSFPEASEVMDLLKKMVLANQTMAAHQMKLLSTSNNFMQMGLALLNFESAYGKFPGDILSEDGKPLLSWRVAVLPYIENQELYEKFHLDEPWDSEHNRSLIRKMPDVFQTRESKLFSSKTHIQRPIGKGTVASSPGIGFKGITDGGSSTIALVEAEDAVTWTQPADFAHEEWQSGAPGTYRLCIMCDGSRFRIPNDYSADKLAAAVRYKDGKPAVDLAEPLRRVIIAERSETVSTEEEVQSLIDKANWDSQEGVSNLLRLAGAASELPRRSAGKIVDKFAIGLKDHDPLKRQLALQGILISCRGVDLPIQGILQVAKNDRFEKNRWLAIQLLMRQFDKVALQSLAASELGASEFLSLLVRTDSEAQRIVPFLADTFLPLLESKERMTLSFALDIFRDYGSTRHAPSLRKLLKTGDQDLKSYVQYLLENRLGDGPLVKAMSENGGDMGAAVEKLAEGARVEKDVVYSVTFEEYSYRKNYEGNLNLNDFKQLATQPLVYISLTESRIDDEGLAVLASIKSLKRLKLINCKFVSSEGFRVLEQLPDLEYLEVNSANFNDLGAVAISKLENLKDLILSGTDLGDTGMAALADLGKLEWLDVSRTLVTDQGLAQFKGHKMLEKIDLFNVGITDKSIDTLLSLKNLRSTNTHSTGITEAGAKRLGNAN